MERYLALLQAQRGIAAWTLTEVKDREWQLYLIGSESESERLVEEHAVRGRVFVHHTDAHGSLHQGIGSILLSPDTSLDAAQRQLDTAVEQARWLKNQPWPLPAPVSAYPQVECADAEFLAAPKEMLAATAAEITRAVAAERGVSVSHLELYGTDRTVRLATSTGVDAGCRQTSFTLYLVLLGANDNHEIDVHIERHLSSPRDLNIGELISTGSRHARDSLITRLPESGVKTVVIPHTASTFLYDTFVTHANGRGRYQKISRFEPGQPVISERLGDALTLVSDGLLPRGVHSCPFDEDGGRSDRVTVIDQGIFQQFICTQEYAHLLQLPVTGSFANRVVGCGSASQDDLLASSPDLLHIVTFSSFMPDQITGDFVGEIRLGYERHGGQWIPVRGGAVSGNIFAAFREVAFAREQVFNGDYLGPAALRLEKLTVAGA